MAKTTLKIIHENNSYAPGEWTSTTWTIKDDLTAIVNIRYYMNDEKDDDLQLKISEDKYNQLFDFLEEGKKGDKDVFALDGSGWEIHQYNSDGIQIYHRDHSYIYGIAGFEKMEKLLYSLNKRLK